jgi:hypothetical protein
MFNSYFFSSDELLEYSDYLSDDDHSVTTGSAFIRRFIPEICSVHFVFLESLRRKSKSLEFHSS